MAAGRGSARVGIVDPSETSYSDRAIHFLVDSNDSDGDSIRSRPEVQSNRPLPSCIAYAHCAFCLLLFACYTNLRIVIITMASQTSFDLPFDQLPNPKQVWVGNPGSYEEGLGRLAILTPEVVARAAATEIKTGRRVTTSWELTKLDYPNLNRQPCHHQIVPLLGGVAFDDIYTMNPRR